MRIYKVLCLTLVIMCAMFMLTVSEQSQTIEQQRLLIRKMETNKRCMTATGGNE
jgi:preprotein translocase subunit YajC